MSADDGSFGYTLPTDPGGASAAGRRHAKTGNSGSFAQAVNEMTARSKSRSMYTGKDWDDMIGSILHRVSVLQDKLDVARKLVDSTGGWRAVNTTPTPSAWGAKRAAVAGSRGEASVAPAAPMGWGGDTADDIGVLEVMNEQRMQSFFSPQAGGAVQQHHSFGGGIWGFPPVVVCD
jgi:hypothetical protein